MPSVLFEREASDTQSERVRTGFPSAKRSSPSVTPDFQHSGSLRCSAPLFRARNSDLGAGRDPPLRHQTRYASVGHVKAIILISIVSSLCPGSFFFFSRSDRGLGQWTLSAFLM